MPAHTPELRAAIIGFGLAGSVFHAPLIAETPGLTVSAIVTSNPKRTEEAEARFPGARVLPSADALFDQGSELDLLVVATPNELHVPLARRALDAGIPVLVDKPLAPTAAEARELVAHATETGTLLTVFMNRRWDSEFREVRRLIDEGTLGEVTRFESRFERWRPEPRRGAWREEQPPELGGGLLLDLGTHLVDQAVQLFGPVRDVYAEVDHRRAGPADDDVFLALRHESGTRSHIWASAVAPVPGPRLRVQGSKEGFVAEELDGQEATLRAGRPLTDPGGWPAFYAELGAALRGEGPPPVDPADAVEVLEILDRARGAGNS